MLNVWLSFLQSSLYNICILIPGIWLHICKIFFIYLFRLPSSLLFSSLSVTESPSKCHSANFLIFHESVSVSVCLSVFFFSLSLSTLSLPLCYSVSSLRYIAVSSLSLSVILSFCLCISLPWTPCSSVFYCYSLHLSFFHLLPEFSLSLSLPHNLSLAHSINPSLSLCFSISISLSIALFLSSSLILCVPFTMSSSSDFLCAITYCINLSIIIHQVNETWEIKEREV